MWQDCVSIYQSASFGSVSLQAMSAINGAFRGGKQCQIGRFSIIRC